MDVSNTLSPDSASQRDFPPLDDWKTAGRRHGRHRNSPSQEPTSSANETPPPPKKTPARKGPWGLPPKANTTLLLPTAENVKIIAELEKTDAIDPRELGIKKKIPFANGALLLTCKDAAAVQKLHSLLPLVKGVKAKEAPPSRNPTIRIHGIPVKTSVEQLQSDIVERFGAPPMSIKFVEYRQPSLVPDTKLAVCEVTATVFEAAAKKKTINVAWKHCRIDVNPHLSRCSRCNLLGHSVKFCQQPENMAVEQVTDSQAATAASPPCKDCTAYNLRVQSAKLGKRRLRKTDHLTGNSQCPTKRHYMQRARPTKPLAPQESDGVTGGVTIDEVA